MNDDRIYDALAGEMYFSGKALALVKYKWLRWSYDIIKQVGNYEEIFNRNIIQKLGLKRGLNQLYSHRGLLYTPPLK